MPFISDTLHRNHAHRTSPIERRSPVESRRLWERRTPSHAEIAELAYSFWEARGRQHGSAVEDWLRAERLLTQRYER